MARWQKLSLAILAILVIVLGAFLGGFALGDHSSDGFSLFGGPGDEGQRIIDDAYSRIRSSAVEPPSAEKLAHGALKGMVRALKDRRDPYALYFSPQGYRAFQQYTSGRFSGIGVWLKTKQGALEIVSVLPRTPALRAGLARGDIIRHIDGRDVSKMSVDQAVGRIKGPAGTQVTLGIERGGTEQSFTLTRQTIALPDVVARLTNGNLGYVRLFGFARGAADQLRQQIDRLTSTGARGIILDLRDNGGGLFSEGIGVASTFIENGKIVTLKQRASPSVTYRAEGTAFDDIPVVVLVNEGTASASEIVAGALQDRDRAILVGSKTYGKGSVQQVFPLGDASALKFTTGTYLTPDGTSINHHGIEPDVVVDASPSVQKQRAVEILKGIVVSTNGAQG